MAKGPSPLVPGQVEILSDTTRDRAVAFSMSCVVIRLLRHVASRRVDYVPFSGPYIYAGRIQPKVLREAHPPPSHLRVNVVTVSQGGRKDWWREIVTCCVSGTAARG